MPTIADIIARGLAVQGTPYSWGGGGPSGASYGFAQGAGIKGFDCSSLMQYMFAGAGIKIPRTSEAQYSNTSRMGLNELRPGDLVFSNFRGGLPGHVGMYIGNGLVLQSPKTGDRVKVSTLGAFGATSAGRVLATFNMDLGNVDGILPSRLQGWSTKSSGSGSGGGGVPGGYTSGQMIPGSGWTKADFEAALASAGFTAAFINSDKEIKALFQKATANRWAADRFVGELKKTKWWASRSDAQRKYDQMRSQDPAEFRSQYQEQRAQLQALADQYGVTVDPRRLDVITESVLRNGLNEAQIRSAIVAEFRYDPSRLYAGMVGKALQDYRGTASSYMMRVADKDLAWWLAETLNGRQDTNSFVQAMKNQAKARWAHFADKIDAGLTMQQIADPYRQEYAKLLEVSSESITDDDQLLQKALDYRDPKSGNRGAMTLWQFGDELRADSRWLRTDNAKKSTMDTAHTVLQAMGLVAM